MTHLHCAAPQLLLPLQGLAELKGGVNRVFGVWVFFRLGHGAHSRSAEESGLRGGPGGLRISKEEDLTRAKLERAAQPD